MLEILIEKSELPLLTSYARSVVTINNEELEGRTAAIAMMDAFATRTDLIADFFEKYEWPSEPMLIDVTARVDDMDGQFCVPVDDMGNRPRVFAVELAKRFVIIVARYVGKHAEQWGSDRPARVRFQVMPAPASDVIYTG